MWQQQILGNKQFNNHNRIKIIKIQCSFYMRVCVCVCVENTAMASWIKIWFVRTVYMLGKFWINVSIFGRSEEDKNWLYLHTCVSVCVCMWGTVSMGILFS